MKFNLLSSKIKSKKALTIVICITIFAVVFFIANSIIGSKNQKTVEGGISDLATSSGSMVVTDERSKYDLVYIYDGNLYASDFSGKDNTLLLDLPDKVIDFIIDQQSDIVYALVSESKISKQNLIKYNEYSVYTETELNEFYFSEGGSKIYLISLKDLSSNKIIDYVEDAITLAINEVSQGLSLVWANDNLLVFTNGINLHLYNASTRDFKVNSEIKNENIGYCYLGSSKSRPFNTFISVYMGCYEGSDLFFFQQNQNNFSFKYKNPEELDSIINVSYIDEKLIILSTNKLTLEIDSFEIKDANTHKEIYKMNAPVNRSLGVDKVVGDYVFYSVNEHLPERNSILYHFNMNTKESKEIGDNFNIINATSLESVYLGKRIGETSDHRNILSYYKYNLVTGELKEIPEYNDYKYITNHTGNKFNIDLVFYLVSDESSSISISYLTKKGTFQNYTTNYSDKFPNIILFAKNADTDFIRDLYKKIYKDKEINLSGYVRDPIELILH